MKNRVWYILLLTSMCATLLTGGCASVEDGPQPPSELGIPITFAGAMLEEQTVTRAYSLHEAGVSSFRLFAYKDDGYDSEAGMYTSYQTVMDGYRVNWIDGSAATTTTNTDNWEYVAQGGGVKMQTVKFWDYAALAYRFAAYAPATSDDVTSEVTGASVAERVLELRLKANADDVANTPYFSELWFSTGSTVDYPERLFGRPVQLRFVKPFSRVRFLFTFQEADAHFDRSDLSDPRFRPADGSTIARKGTFTVRYPLAGIATATEAQWAMTPVTGGEAVAPAVLDYLSEDWQTGGQETWYTVLPCQTQGDYELTVNVGTDNRTAYVPAGLMRWVAGYDYTYVFKITEAGGVQFDLMQLGLRNWNDTEDMSHEIYNW